MPCTSCQKPARVRASLRPPVYRGAGLVWTCLLLPVSRLVFAVVEKLLARDLVVFGHCIDADFLKRDALPGGLGRDVEGEVDRELIGVRAIEERPGDGLAVEGLVGDPVL